MAGCPVYRNQERLVCARQFIVVAHDYQQSLMTGRGRCVGTSYKIWRSFQQKPKKQKRVENA